ncbi:hypothetical protein PHYSODRAFT_337662 [Phytophthora sojae]|uniref:Uncharacterized protein n=1 Tax=Phytophthora sojae (strain P6497) TaxID=1094619 RepID=G5A1U1_PHYSP|nr:hypothetical protein PHYSODRAFT_337662 [Phytophthora sojae]EGZ10889.1 hypothetical protein PHYSODRAFT_337662 [Phytophthora sojae]|eukprot:XP_009533634.1 hypothetical protein PHYSODRAFT_337662 [Phytophthora sojae]
MVVEEMLAFCEGLSNPKLGVGAYHRSSCEAHAHGSRTQIKGGVTHYSAAHSVNCDSCYGLYPERGEEYADGSIKNIHLNPINTYVENNCATMLSTTLVNDTIATAAEATTTDKPEDLVQYHESLSSHANVALEISELSRAQHDFMQELWVN